MAIAYLYRNSCQRAARKAKLFWYQKSGDRLHKEEKKKKKARKSWTMYIWYKQINVAVHEPNEPAGKSRSPQGSRTLTIQKHEERTKWQKPTPVTNKGREKIQVSKVGDPAPLRTADGSWNSPHNMFWTPPHPCALNNALSKTRKPPGTWRAATEANALNAPSD